MHDRGRAGFVETLVDAVLAVLPTSDLTPLQAKLDEMVAVATEAGGKSDATEAVSLAATVLLDWATELRATLALPGVPGEQ